MAYLISYDVTQTFEESSITDETLLKFAKELYKKGFIKASIEYDEETDTNRLKYFITASKTEPAEWASESTKDKQTGENQQLDKKNKKNFLKCLFNDEKKLD